MPFFQTSATAGGGGVLGDKYRMAAHRRLFAVGLRLRWREPPVNEIGGVLRHGIGSVIHTIFVFFQAKMKALAKGGRRQTLKNVVG